MASMADNARRALTVEESGRQRDELVTKLLRRRGGRQYVIPEALAQGDLLDLAGSGMGDLVDDHHVVGHPPLGDLALQEPEQLLLGRRLLFLKHDHKQRPLAPPRS